MALKTLLLQWLANQVDVLVVATDEKIPDENSALLDSEKNDKIVMKYIILHYDIMLM